MSTDSQTPFGQQGNPVVPNSAGSRREATADVVDPSKSKDSEGSVGACELNTDSVAGQQSQVDLAERNVNIQSDSSDSNGEPLCLPGPSSSCRAGEIVKSTGSKQAPLGLGGGLQPKRQSEQSKNGEAGPSSNSEQSQQARISGQQTLQTLASRSIAGGSNLTDHGAELSQQGLGQSMPSLQANAEGSDVQVDVTGMMTQLLEGPALNGLLSGVSQQTGVGSPNVLRNMLRQLTQNPVARNTVNQLAQQVDREEFRNMFSGMGAGEDGNLDFSTMIGQMMPVVSQVLGGNSVQNDQLRNMVPELLPDIRSSEENTIGPVSQNNIQEVVQSIALSSPQEIFRSMVRYAAEYAETTEGEFVNRLLNNQDLANQFVELFRNELLRRLSGYYGSSGGE